VTVPCLHHLAPLLATLADPHRLRLVDAIAGGAHTVEALRVATGLPGPVLASHLRRLLDAGVIARRRHGNGTRYRVARPALARWLIAGDRALSEL
jgi:DNA-binding transcriptional ArsR family regulator